MKDELFQPKEVPAEKPQTKAKRRRTEAEEISTPVEAPARLVVCGKCGGENRPGANFCKMCGNKLVSKPARLKQAEKGEKVGEKEAAAGEVKAAKKGELPRRVLFVGIHDGRVIGDKVSGFDEVFAFLTSMGVEVKYEVAKGEGLP